MRTFSKTYAAGRRGIALVVVLALLAMLVIMAVSFVTFMRAERSASRDYADSVRARNVALAGISRALVQAQQHMNQSNQFYYGGGFYTTGSGEICSNWMIAGFAFLDHYIPNYGTINTLLNDSEHLGKCKWTNMTYQGIGGNNVLAGRYSVIFLDCSHFLNINTISNVAQRGNGIRPEEVAMPPDDIQNGANLIAMRQQHLFESLTEANLRNRSAPMFNTGYQYQPRHLLTYSYCPIDTYWGNNQQNGRVVIGTNAPSILAQKARIQNVASTLGLDTSFYDNLYDFANRTTVVPSNPNQMGGGKLVPMLYEIIVTNGLRRVNIGGKLYWDVETRCLVETWFPFPVTDNKTFSINMPAPQISLSSVPPMTLPWLPVAGSNNIATPNSIATATNSFWTNKFIAVYRNADTNMLSSVTTTIKWSGNITVNTGGSPVDQAPVPTTAQTMTFVAAPGVPVVSKGWGVNDPRINWRTSDWVANKAADPVKTQLGRTNDLCDTTSANGDGSTFMFVQRQTNNINIGLSSIGDLGYLLYDASKPWHTVRMMGPDAADPKNTRRLFDMLSLLPTNKIYQGFVNPNSQDAGSLLCAFLGARKERYPGEATGTRMTQAESSTLANRLISLGMKGSGYTKAYTNISDVCRLQASDITAGADFWQKKGILRNSLGLLYPRQNYWLVLVCAQATKDVNNNGTYEPGTDFVTAETQAMAFIWRDPYEDPADTTHPAGQRRHKMFVQFFKWL